ncbi:hypothetical protein J2S07_001352 [Robertmurraya andreesenii]|uniref:Uncharacterized protein n=1 Tax=Anoxybacillus andreesenii TaxID=1325932 RepID=A0ABT9V265_9BACL|nr:hypothetical protein [Robertmurraya andreesenii]
MFVFLSIYTREKDNLSLMLLIVKRNNKKQGE